jgi:hypothetical protein
LFNVENHMDCRGGLGPPRALIERPYSYSFASPRAKMLAT